MPGAPRELGMGQPCLGWHSKAEVSCRISQRSVSCWGRGSRLPRPEAPGQLLFGESTFRERIWRLDLQRGEPHDDSEVLKVTSAAGHSLQSVYADHIVLPLSDRVRKGRVTQV